MANENGNIEVDENKVSIEDMLKNSGDLSTRSNEDLTSFLDEYSKDKDYGAIAALATELDRRSKKETISIDPELSNQLAEEAAKKEESNKEFNTKLETEKQENKSENKDKVEELTAKLNNADEKIGSLEETVNKLLEDQKENREETSQSLENILKSKKSGDSETVNKLLEEIKKLKQTKNEINIKYSNEIGINPLETKMFFNGFMGRKKLYNKDGTESAKKSFVMTSPSIIRHRRSRRKLNKVVNSFNGFKKDSDSAVKYILSQERGDRVDTITGVDALVQSMNRGRYGIMHKTGFVMSKAKFEEKFDKQQKKIIDKFKNNINPAENTSEDETIKALEARMKYYKQDYMNKHY